MSKRDYYEVLGVSKTASESEVKKAYRKAALQFHPDRNPGDTAAEESFKEASEAYEVLMDGQKRQIYDQYGHQGLSGQGFSGFQDVNDIFSSFGNVFEDFFGFGGGGGGRTRQRRGADLRYDLQIDLRDAVFGVEKEIEFEREAPCGTCDGTGAKSKEHIKTCQTCGGAGQVRRSQGFFSVATTCPTCHGRGQVIAEECGDCHGKGVQSEKKKLSVNIPAGVDHGMKLRVSGEGEGGSAGAPRGDLYVVLHVKDEKGIERDGVHIIKEVKIGIAQATLGSKFKIETLDGEKEIEIPAGSQYGDSIRLTGLGVPRLRGSGRGDFYVHLKVIVPSKMNKEQKEAMQQFAKASDESVKESSGFFQKIFE